MRAATYLKLSLAVAFATMALKAAAWWLTGSVGLLSDAIESLVNVAGAGFALTMVTVAAQPPDEEHPYGHHKAEYFSSGLEGMLIFGAGIVILWTALPRLIDPQPLASLGVGLALSLAATALNAVLAVAMLRKGRAVRSIALEGDARHLLADVWTSVGIVAALVGVTITGWLWLDPLAAVLVALHILRESVSLLRRSADGLMDHALEDDVRADIERTLQGLAHPAIRFDHVVTRRAGQRRFVDMHMHVPAGWTLRRAATLRGSVEQALMSAVPGLRATIQLLPSDVEAHLDDAEDPT
jgi:cation diffusion facilitator family transporter